MTRFAEEYGNALFELADDEQISDRIAQELQQVLAILNQESDYIRLLNVQSIDSEERKRLLDEAFGGSIHPYLIHFMKLLIDRGAISKFEECADAYRLRYNEAMGIVEADVTSAAALSQEQIEALRAKLGAISGKKVEMRVNVDPKLIGGLRVDMLGKRYDNSVLTQLRQIRRSLTEQE